MKKLFYLLAILAAVFTFAACGGDDEPTPNAPTDKEKEQTDSTSADPTKPTPQDSTSAGVAVMKVSALIGSYGLDYATPRLVFTCDGMMTTEINDPSQPEMLILHVVGQDKNADALVMVSRKNFILAHYVASPVSSLSSEVLLAGDFDDFSTLSYCTIDWKTGDVGFIESLPLSPEGKPSLTKTTRGENDAIKKPFFDMVDYISTQVGKMGEKMDNLGKIGKGGKAVCTAINEAVVPLMRYNLYADDEIAQQKYVEEYVEDRTKKLFCEVTGIEEDYLNFALWAYNNANRLRIGSDDDPTNYSSKYYPMGQQQTQQVTTVVNQSAAVLNATIHKNTDVEVSVEVTGFDENSISLKGSVRFNDSSYGSYLSAGYCYYNGSQEVRLNSKVTSDGIIEPGTITKLDPATRYAVAAYYEPMTSSHKFYSEFIDVVTRGVLFSPAQESLEVDCDGGTFEIPIKMGYETKWEVSTAPSWCTCSPQEGKLVVKVQKTEAPDDRSDAIILTAKGYYGDTTSSRILVYQKGKDDGGDDDDVGSWADTKWQMTGTLTANDEPVSDSFIADFTGGTIRFIGQGELGAFYSAAKLTPTVTGNDLIVNLYLVIESNHEESRVVENWNYHFHRDNSNSVTCTVGGVEAVGGKYSYAVTGNYSGTRLQ
jgi:predicted small lipoprotein YifL